MTRIVPGLLPNKKFNIGFKSGLVNLNFSYIDALGSNLRGISVSNDINPVKPKLLDRNIGVLCLKDNIFRECFIAGSKIVL